MTESIYEVTRADYKSFVEQLKPEFRDVRVEKIGIDHIAAKIFSKKTGKCLCSRVTYAADYGEPEPERYYIFEMPDDDERQAPIPTQQIVLKTKEEVQALFDFITKQRKCEE